MSGTGIGVYDKLHFFTPKTPNLDKPEKTNFKTQISNKYQI